MNFSNENNFFSNENNSNNFHNNFSNNFSNNFNNNSTNLKNISIEFLNKIIALYSNERDLEFDYYELFPENILKLIRISYFTFCIYNMNENSQNFSKEISNLFGNIFCSIYTKVINVEFILTVSESKTKSNVYNLVNDTMLAKSYSRGNYVKFVESKNFFDKKSEKSESFFSEKIEDNFKNNLNDVKNKLSINNIFNMSSFYKQKTKSKNFNKNENENSNENNENSNENNVIKLTELDM